MLIQVEVKEDIARLTLNRPKQLNALSQELITQFRETLKELAQREDVSALIVTGAGKAFCAGSDVKELHGIGREAAEPMMRNEAMLCDEIETFPFPTIAAVNGYALGGGFTLALSHDIRIASEFAVFGAPEVKLGWSPPFGIAQAVRILGETVAKDLLMSGREVLPSEAIAVGIISRIVPQEDLLATAEEIAHTFTGLPRRAVRSCKQQVNRISREIGKAISDEEMQAFLDCLETEDAQRGISYFVSKRKP